jgi:hypothetical protein
MCASATIRQLPSNNPPMKKRGSSRNKEHWAPFNTDENYIAIKKGSTFKQRNISI